MFKVEQKINVTSFIFCKIKKCLFFNKPLINLLTMWLGLKQFYKFAALKVKVRSHSCTRPTLSHI